MLQIQQETTVAMECTQEREIESGVEETPGHGGPERQGQHFRQPQGPAPQNRYRTDSAEQRQHHAEAGPTQREPQLQPIIIAG